MTRRWLVGILLVSFALRLGIVMGGGQHYWADEFRYDSAINASSYFAHGDIHSALKELFGHADHVLFRPVALPPALVDYALGGEHPFLVAVYFSLFSLGTLFMIWAVARRAGAGEAEAIWAVFLAACSSSLLIYARFYLPYDAAMFVIMVALWLALGKQSAFRSFLTGAVAACGFLIYNGYWLLAGTILILYTLLGGGDFRKMLVRGVLSGTGLIVAVAAVLAVGAAVSPGLLAQYGSFASSVTQGDFHLGYRVIAEYFWFGEGCVSLVWLAALGAAGVMVGRTLPGNRLSWWLGGLAMILGGLVFFSDVVPKFVIYGRLARSAAPFACLGAAQGISLFLDHRRFRLAWTAAIGSAVALMGLANASVPLFQVFPDKFMAMAARKVAQYDPSDFRFYRLLFAESLWGSSLKVTLEPHEVVLQSANPLHYRPFQLEGFPAADRDKFNATDISMRMVRFDTGFRSPDPDLEGYPGPVALSVAFHPEEGSDSQPLVTSGKPGIGDCLFVRHVDARHIIFGLDHWGHHLAQSAPVELDMGATHRLEISAGSLMPPESARFFSRHPLYKPLREQVVVIVDGAVVWSQRAEFYPSTPRDITFGVNLTGGTTTLGSFCGAVSAFSFAGFRDVAMAVPSIALSEIALDRSSEWSGAVGPIRLRFTPPEAGTGTFVGQPLLAIGGPGSTDLLSVERSGKDVIIVFDSRGRAPLRSAPVALLSDGSCVLDVCVGSMLPGPTAPIYSRVPGFGAMRGRVYVSMSGQPVLAADRTFEPADVSGMAVGENTVACSTCGAYFQGEIGAPAPIGPENLLPFGSRIADLLVNPDLRWGGFTGPLKLRVRFPAGLKGSEMPLLLSGTPGSSDAVSVVFDSDTQIRVRYTHSGDEPELSGPVSIAPGEIQELLVSSAVLMPPEGAAIYKDVPELERLRSFTEVGVNGRPVLVSLRLPHPATPGQIEIGGHGAIETLSMGNGTEPLSLGSLGRAFSRPGWDGYPGPVSMTVVVPDHPGNLGLPLVTTGYPGGGDFVFLAHDTGDLFRVSQDHWGSVLATSEPFHLPAGAEHTVTVSFGALYPPEGSLLYSSHPDLLANRGRIVVTIDGKRVFFAEKPSHPTAPDRIIVGANLIGGSSANAVFSGKIRDVSLAPLDAANP